MPPFSLRTYTAADEEAAIELWRRTWAQHFPHIDFNARVAWWRERWRQELVPVAHIVLAEVDEVPAPVPFIHAQAGIQGQSGGASERGPGSSLSRGRAEKKLAGFVTVDPKTGYLDQIVVAPEHWGSGVALALLDEAKRLAPAGLDLLVNKDNTRAIRFYEKHGLAYAGEDKNPVSGIPVNRMRWRP